MTCLILLNTYGAVCRPWWIWRVSCAISWWQLVHKERVQWPLLSYSRIIGKFLSSMWWMKGKGNKVCRRQGLMVKSTLCYYWLVTDWYVYGNWFVFYHVKVAAQNICMAHQKTIINKEQGNQFWNRVIVIREQKNVSDNYVCLLTFLRWFIVSWPS